MTPVDPVPPAQPENERQENDQARVERGATMPPTGSTASGIWRYVHEAFRDVVSIGFSVALAVNVVFWFHFIFGVPIHSYLAVLGYAGGVTFIHQVHIGIHRALTQPKAEAWTYDIGKSVWSMAVALSDDAVDPVLPNSHEPTTRERGI